MPWVPDGTIGPACAKAGRRGPCARGRVSERERGHEAGNGRVQVRLLGQYKRCRRSHRHRGHPACCPSRAGKRGERPEQRTHNWARSLLTLGWHPYKSGKVHGEEKRETSSVAALGQSIIHPHPPTHPPISWMPEPKPARPRSLPQTHPPTTKSGFSSSPTLYHPNPVPLCPPGLPSTH